MGLIDLSLVTGADVPTPDPDRAIVFIDAVSGKISAKFEDGNVAEAGGLGPVGPVGPPGPVGPVGATGAQGIPGVPPAPVAMHAATNYNLNQAIDFTVAPSNAVPRFCCVLTCITAETNFAVGDQIFVTPAADSQTTNAVIQVGKTAAGVWRVRTSATAPRLIGMANGVAQAITIGRWSIQTFQV